MTGTSSGAVLPDTQRSESSADPWAPILAAAGFLGVSAAVGAT